MTTNEHIGNGNGAGHTAPVPPATPEELNDELIHEARRVGPRMRTLIIVLGMLSVLAFVGAGMRLVGGTDDHTAWRYYAVCYFYVFSLTAGIPLAAIGLRMARAQWRRPTSRLAEVFLIAGPLHVIFFLPLLAGAPPITGTDPKYNTMWMDWQLGPWLPDLIMVSTLAITGLALLYTSALPDLAAVRDHGALGRSKNLARRLARGWSGTNQQWKMQKTALGILGAFYVAMYAMTHFSFSTDFAISMVPGWKDPIFPAFHAVSGLQMGLGLYIVVMFALRKFHGLGRYFELEQFWGFSRLLVVLTLFWFYFWWSAFILFWYGRLPHEQGIIALFVFGDPNQTALLARPQFLMFAGAIGLSFIIPFLTIMWNPVRRSFIGPTIVGLIIIAGGFFDRLRIYSNSWSVEQVGGHGLDKVPTLGAPDIWDAAFLVGLLSAVAFLVLLLSRLIPFVSLWETREALLLRVIRPFGVGYVSVVGKPE
jgi:hypothetical protein